MYSALSHTTPFRITPWPRRALQYCQGSLLKSAVLFALTALWLLAMSSLTPGGSAYAQSPPDLSGTWRGTLIAGQYDPLEIVFHIQGDSNHYTATLDIPAQSRLGMTVDSVSLLGSNIMIRMASIQAEYYGSLVFSADGGTIEALNGDWGQSGEHMPLKMLRAPAQP